MYDMCSYHVVKVAYLEVGTPLIHWAYLLYSLLISISYPDSTTHTTMPHFPEPFTSSVSHWQATNRGPDSLYSHGNSSSQAPDPHGDTVPETADIVIIGGGTMGASLAYYLTRKGGAGQDKRVVLLEAKMSVVGLLVVMEDSASMDL